MRRWLLPPMILLAVVFLTGAAARNGNLLVDDFDGAGPKIGKSWEIHVDKNGLGTKLQPFSKKAGSAESAEGKHGHIAGHLGKNVEPWPFASVALAFDSDGPKDLSAYKAIRFHAKGDGKEYRVSVGRKANVDGCHFEHAFAATKEWTAVVCPLDDFTQPDWGKQLDKGFKDAVSVRFEAPRGADDEDLELRIDDVEFLAALPATKAP